MIRWAIGLIILGLLVFCFFSPYAGSQIIEVGKWVLGVALIIWVVLLFAGRGGGYGAPTTLP